MNIKKNWFVRLSEVSDEKIIISDDLEVVIFDDTKDNKQIHIWENVKLEVYGVIEERDDYSIHFIQEKDNSTLVARYLLLSKNNKKIKAKIHSDLEADNTSSDVKIISIIWNDGFVDLDGVIQIWRWIKWVRCKLVEENLFLWSTWKAKWIPTLLVRSDDVEASHACKMERISDEKLFYLRSRWVGKEDALSLMVESYIADLLWWLKERNLDLYDQLVWDIEKQI